MIVYLVAEANEDGNYEAVLGQHKGGRWEGIKRIRCYDKPGKARSYRTILRKQGRNAECFGVQLPGMIPGFGDCLGQIWKMDA